MQRLISHYGHVVVPYLLLIQKFDKYRQYSQILHLIDGRIISPLLFHSIINSTPVDHTKETK